MDDNITQEFFYTSYCRTSCGVIRCSVLSMANTEYAEFLSSDKKSAPQNDTKTDPAQKGRLGVVLQQAMA